MTNLVQELYNRIAELEEIKRLSDIALENWVKQGQRQEDRIAELEAQTAKLSEALEAVDDLGSFRELLIVPEKDL